MIAAIALVTGVNVFNSQKTIAMSDMALANVEALAYIKPYTGLIYLQGELGTGGCINCPEPKDTNCTCK